MLDRKSQVKIKHALDRAGALLLVTLLSPVLLLIGAIVKLEDRGPAFFRQDRLGRNGKIFRVWKFRTMVPNADRLLDERGRVGKVNRVTRVGRVLRKLSLDELPQLINILLGEMSFVGPRPAVPSHLQRYTETQMGRLRMKPGVTGWAQVNGRNTLKWSKRIEHDLWYIEHYSLWLDVKLILMTFRVVMTGRGVVLDRNPEEVDDLRLADNAAPAPGASKSQSQ